MTLVGHTGLIDDLAFTPDGANLVTGAADNTVKVWDLSPGRELLTIVEGNPGEAVYSPGGMRLATAQSGVHVPPRAQGGTVIHRVWPDTGRRQPSPHFGVRRLVDPAPGAPWAGCRGKGATFGRRA